VASAAEILADVANPGLAEWEVRDQLGRIGEIAEGELAANEEAALLEKLHAEAFRNAGLGLPLFTPSYNASNLTHETLQKVVKQLYTPDRLVFVGAGGVTHDVLVALAEQHLSKLTGQSGAAKVPSQYFGGNDVRVPGAGATELGIAFQGVAYSNIKDVNAVGVLQYILGGSSFASTISPNQTASRVGAASRFGRNVPQKNSFVQRISTVSLNYPESGLFAVLAKADRGNAASLVQAIGSELGAVARNGVSAEELAAGKAQFKASVLFNDTKSGLLQFIGTQALFRGNVQTPAEVAKAIDSISASDVAAAAKRVFSSRPTVVAVGDVSGLPTVEQIQKLIQ